MSQKVIISISTIPPRFELLGEALNSLLNQKRRADEIHVYIPRIYRRFPRHSFALPNVPNGISIKVVEEDYGPATKILPCVLENKNSDIRIVYGDDDRFADIRWLDEILTASRERPNAVIASQGMTLSDYGLSASEILLPQAKKMQVWNNHRYLFSRINQKLTELFTGKKLRKPGRSKYKKSGYVDFALGMGGVSVKPEFFDNECFKIPKMLWTVDDIWLSGCFKRQKINIWADKKIHVPIETNAGLFSPLVFSNIEGKNRKQADMECINYMSKKYGIWQ
ncbi:hypothetical protein N9R41_00310 [bacterium]|nr:hypothetical protein [bacterium]